MLVEVKHHYGWTLHDEPVDDLFAAALRAVRAAGREILTDDNHRLERGAWTGDTTHCGGVKVITLRRLSQFFGGAIEPGGYWYSHAYRRHFPHGTTALDGRGRRWAHVSLDGWPRASGPYSDGPQPWRAACSQWACVDDPREMMLDYPHSFARPYENFIFGRATPATDAELARARLLWSYTHDLDVLADVAARRCTPTQAADRLKISRRDGDRRQLLARRAWRLAARLRGEGQLEPPDTVDLDAATDELLRLAGIAELVAVERSLNRNPVRRISRPARKDMSQ